MLLDSWLIILSRVTNVSAVTAMLYIVLLQDTERKNKLDRLLANTYTPITFLLKRVDCLKAAWAASEKICFLATDIRLGENDNFLFFSFAGGEGQSSSPSSFLSPHRSLGLPLSLGWLHSFRKAQQSLSTGRGPTQKEQLPK